MAHGLDATLQWQIYVRGGQRVILVEIIFGTLAKSVGK